MAGVYADLIRKGKRALEQVPEKIRLEVEALLKLGKSRGAEE